MVDPGAQEGCTGTTAYHAWKDSLAAVGLKPREIDVPPNMDCGGVGGGARVAIMADMPVGVARVNGILRMHVLEDKPGHEVPTLVPVNFLRAMKAVMDMDEGSLEFKAANAKTTMKSLPSGHYEISLMQFDDGGWHVPEHAEDVFPNEEFKL